MVGSEDQMFKELKEQSQITLDFVSVVTSKIDLYGLVRELTELALVKVLPFYRSLIFVAVHPLHYS